MMIIFSLFEKYREIILYLLVGCMTMLVTLAVYFACVLSFLDPESAWQLQLANMISWLAAVIFAYASNRRYVFKSENKDIRKEATQFFFSRLGTLFVDMVFMFIAVTLIGLNDKLAKLIDQILVVLANYVLSKFWVFRKDEE